MKNQTTTKDLMALNELMTFENWMAVKMKQYQVLATDKSLKTMFKNMATAHCENHKKLLNYLSATTGEGGKN